MLRGHCTPFYMPWGRYPLSIPATGGPCPCLYLPWDHCTPFLHGAAAPPFILIFFSTPLSIPAKGGPCSCTCHGATAPHFFFMPWGHCPHFPMPWGHCTPFFSMPWGYCPPFSMPRGHCRQIIPAMRPLHPSYLPRGPLHPVYKP